MSTDDLADGLEPHDIGTIARTTLEARILKALGRKDEAQSLRWSAFEAWLHAGTLREYIAALPDFEDVEALDRAFAFALASPHIYKALTFLMEWPRLDLAARHVVAHQGEWDGRHYYTLPPAADALAHEYPLAASLIYRALLDDILSRARSKAYPHAARYLGILDVLSSDADAQAGDNPAHIPHPDYRAGLTKTHGRKSGFWSLVMPD